MNLQQALEFIVFFHICIVLYSISTALNKNIRISVYMSTDHKKRILWGRKRATTFDEVHELFFQIFIKKFHLGTF